MPVLGRSTEREFLARVIDGARTGQGSAAVIVGCVGVGKTALINDVADGFTDVVKIRIGREDFDVDSPYSGLRSLVMPFSHVLAELSESRSRAMGLALGLREDGVADSCTR